MEAELVIFLCIIIFLVSSCLGMFGGYHLATTDAHEEAVKEGHAEYYLDADHNKQWRWKAISEAKQ